MDASGMGDAILAKADAVPAHSLARLPFLIGH